MELKGSSILVIDDDPVYRGTVSWLLRANGFAVETASTGTEAYSIISIRHFDLIIVDIMLPDIDGLELIRWVREQADFDNTPIMAVSGYDRNYLVAAISAGANEALCKPDDLDRIVEAATKLIRRIDDFAGRAGSYRRAS